VEIGRMTAHKPSYNTDFINHALQRSIEYKNFLDSAIKQ
jgi:hypothetical protein